MHTWFIYLYCLLNIELFYRPNHYRTALANLYRKSKTVWDKSYKLLTVEYSYKYKLFTIQQKLYTACRQVSLAVLMEIQNELVSSM